MKMPLKMKLTATSVIILTVMCLCLTITATYAANILTHAVETAPAQETGSAEGVQSGTELNDTAAKRFRTTTVFAMVALIGIGSVLTYVFAAKSMKPLERLTEAADHINLNNLDENIPLPNTGDEVERLTKSFNDMTTKLSASYAVQKNFSANAAHELRTPLAAIQTQLDVFMLRPDRNKQEYDDLFKSIADSTERLSTLVNDLLSFINEQSVDLSEKVDLRSLTEEIILELEEQAAKTQVKITCSGAGTVYGNDNLLQRALYNLISNAIRYNVDGGSVVITITDKEFIVSDTGIGIPDEAKPGIFNSFFCVDKSRSRELGGSGLGLSIAKNIIEKHGGYIYVMDNRPRGSVFVVGFDKDNLHEIQTY